MSGLASLQYLHNRNFSNTLEHQSNQPDDLQTIILLNQSAYVYI